MAQAFRPDAAPGDAATYAAESGVTYNRRALFWICSLAMFTAALSFSLRTAASGAIKAEIYDPVDIANSGQLIGSALGAGFAGFAIALLVVAPILDLVGAKRVLLAASACYIVGPLLLIASHALGGAEHAGAFVYLGMMLAGAGWGCTEGSANPLTAAIYGSEKTGRLNMLHAWWPAGIIVGGLASILLFGEMGADWRVGIALIALSGLVLGIWTLGQTFPKTQSTAAGLNYREMLLEPIRQPTFWVFFAIMFLTASTELAPGSWVDITLTETVHMPGILVLVYMSVVAFVMRHFAGTLAARFSDMGLLWFTTIPAAVGLYLLSIASSPVTALAAATIWAFGVCFMWPTMLAAVANRYPRGGAWTIGLVGFAGAMAMRFVLPMLGSIYDSAKIARAGGEQAFALLQKGPELSAVLAYAARMSFRTVAIIPVVLFFLFAIVCFAERHGHLGAKHVSSPAE